MGCMKHSTHSAIRPIVGVMGPGAEASDDLMAIAHRLGTAIAQQGWVVLTGGRNVGVMQAVSRGAKESNGWVIGILPDGDRSQLCDAVDIPILTGMGNARNVINVLSSEVVIACGIGLGTVSEVALALKVGRPVILLSWPAYGQQLFQDLAPDRTWIAHTPEAAIAYTQQLLNPAIA